MWSGPVDDIDVVFGDFLIAGYPQHGKQLTCKLCFMFSISAAPCAGLDLKIRSQLRLSHMVEVDEEFRALIKDTPA